MEVVGSVFPKALRNLQKLSMDKKVKLLRVLNHVLVVGACVRLEFPQHWYMISFLSIVLFGKVGIDIGFHRYFTHQSFLTTPLVERALLILGTLSGLGSSIAWAGTHKHHHRVADSVLDPHTPHGGQNWWKVWLTWWERPVHFLSSDIKGLLINPWHAFLHRHYFSVVLGFMVLLSLISFKALIIAYSIPIVYVFHMSGLVNIVCHQYGYRNFDTRDKSTNNLWVNIVTLGGGLHNNHHAFPSDVRLSHRWYEWDPSGTFALRVLSRKSK